MSLYSLLINNKVKNYKQQIVASYNGLFQEYYLSDLIIIYGLFINGIIFKRPDFGWWG